MRWFIFVSEFIYRYMQRCVPYFGFTFQRVTSNLFPGAFAPCYRAPIKMFWQPVHMKKLDRAWTSSD